MHAHTDTHTFIEIICEDKSGPEIVIQPVWGFQNDWDQYDTGLSFGIHTDKKHKCTTYQFFSNKIS